MRTLFEDCQGSDNVNVTYKEFKIPSLFLPLHGSKNTTIKTNA